MSVRWRRSETFDGLTGWATYSPGETHRYRLGRRWGDGPKVVFVLLNPSTATETADDPTIRRCTGFAAREGYGTLEVVNLYSYRATDPRDLAAVSRITDDTDAQILEAGATTQAAIFACGAPPAVVPRHEHDQRLRDVYTLLWNAIVPIHCLGLTKHGYPKHPLYLRADTPLQPYLPYA